jgi:hypothetical protein
MDDWVPLEPSAIDLSTVSVRTGRSACEKILRASRVGSAGCANSSQDCRSSDEAPVGLSRELADEILDEERRAGGGTAYVLKRLKVRYR